MTDDEINIILAKWAGWKRCDFTGANNDEEWWHKDGCPSWFRNTPRYTTSLNAVAQIEAKLTEEQWQEYRRVMFNAFFDGKTLDLRGLISATAAQKCQAIVRALGLDGEGAE